MAKQTIQALFYARDLNWLNRYLKFLNEFTAIWYMP